jgi:oxazoline/thiazoline dehydrogenase
MVSGMQHIYTLQLMRDVEAREDDQDIFVVGPSGAALRLRRPSGAFRTMLDRLALGGMDRNTICDEAMGAIDGRAADRARLSVTLHKIERKGFVRYTVAQSGRALATLEPVAPAFRLQEVSADGKFLLSRFAYLRRIDDHIMVECPLGHARVVIHDGRGAALLALLAAPHTAAELAATIQEFDEVTITAFIVLLANAKAVSPCVENGRIKEDDSVSLRQWEFHDLLFHSRSRLGRHNYPYGGTFRFLDALPSLAAVRPPWPARRIALYKPDAQALESDGVSFSRVTEARRSVRRRGKQPLSASQLGEFLYRVARVKQVHPARREHGNPYKASTRPCANGGAIHELELYLTLSRCAGIEPGFYHYDPLAHELARLADLGPPQKRLLFDACVPSGLDTPPDVLITLAARFQRVAWKYQSMAYALTLKNTGALYQQMYLVATAMNLSPCGLGGGDSDLFAEAAGLDYYAETSVGEFMLSGR